ncbi:unnamed protein product [Adineta ricciae]|uniref:Uncharacterized protein n=1 Tax=Adineta ricciae TaxID=249248 RepID=A0A815P783_ADIRI|nr:unnamed protein product [Adineta ricciae]CAF1535756.1 unnamed protein product [Adineta ricciae]
MGKNKTYHKNQLVELYKLVYIPFKTETHTSICSLVNTFSHIQFKFSSEFNTHTRKYCRDYKRPHYHHRTFEINVKKSGIYAIWSRSEMDTYGYIYEDNFDPLQPFGNLIAQHGGKCNQHQLKFFIHLQENTKYILVVTTFYPNRIRNFTIFISSDNHFIVDHSFDSKQRCCSLGDRCYFYSTKVGLSLDDLLRSENQSLPVQITAAVTIMIFIIGLIDRLFSCLTFTNRKVRQVGGELYLLTSSIASLLTNSMFFVNFCFTLLTRINVSTSYSILS